MEQVNAGLYSNKKKFVDLFAGLGGFHVGMSRLGHECVMASELDPELRIIYEKNFGLLPEGDVRKINEKLIPKHDVLCAGFPCQPFSRAGKQKGAECPESGKLIDDIFRIARQSNPSYIILENVPDILTIADGRFWSYIKEGLLSLGYCVDYKIYTPQDFGIPQNRKRVFVVASKAGLDHFSWPASNNKLTALKKIFNKNSKNKKYISIDKEAILKKWQELINEINEFSSLPVLASEFGATYPFEDKVKTVRKMSEYKGAFGVELKGLVRWKDVNVLLPRYAQAGNGLVDYRVAEAIEYSRNLYARHKTFLDQWKIGMSILPGSWLKLEWQGHRHQPNIWEHIIQFRASGIRIIKPNVAPSLIAMSTTQLPIYGPEKRYITIREAAALQSLDELSNFPSHESTIFKALGNAVNAHIVNRIAARLII